MMIQKISKKNIEELIKITQQLQTKSSANKLQKKVVLIKKKNQKFVLQQDTL